MGARNVVVRSVKGFLALAVLLPASAGAQERLISYNTDHEVPAAVSIQAGIQRGDTSVVVWGTYSYSSDWRIRYHLVAQALHDTVQIGRRTMVTDTSCVPSYFVALAPIADRFLVIWTDHRAVRAGLYGRILSSRAEPIGQPFLLIEGSDARREHVRMFSGDGCVLLVHRPRTGDTTGLDLLAISGTGIDRRIRLPRTSLSGVRPLGELRGLLACDADSCRVVDGQGVIAPRALSGEVRLAQQAVFADSSWLMIKGDLLCEYASLWSGTPTRVRPIRDAASQAVLLPMRDSIGGIRVLHCYDQGTNKMWNGPCIIATDVAVDADTVRLNGRDTLWNVPFSQPVVAYTDLHSGRTMRHLPRNQVQFRSTYTVSRYSRIGSTKTIFVFDYRTMSAHLVVADSYSDERPDAWLDTVALVPVERLPIRGSSAVRISNPDTVVLAERLDSVANVIEARSPSVFATRIGAVVSWSEGEYKARRSIFNRGTRGEGFSAASWLEKGSEAARIRTPGGELLWEVSAATPYTGGRLVQAWWVADDVSLLRWDSIYRCNTAVRVQSEPDTRTIRVVTREYRTPSERFQVREFRIPIPRDTIRFATYYLTSEESVVDFPLASGGWVVMSNGRPSAIRRLRAPDRPLTCNLDPRPSAWSMRVTGGRLLQSWWSNASSAWVVERLAIDTVADVVTRTDSVSLPGVPATPAPVFVEDLESGEVFVLWARDSVILASLSNSFEARLPYRIAPGAVQPSEVSGVVVGDTLYVVWVDQRTQPASIWGMPIALDAITRQAAPRPPEPPRDTTEPPVIPPVQPPAPVGRDVRVWPVPASSTIHVITGTAGESIVRFDLMDIEGRVLQTHVVETKNVDAATTTFPAAEFVDGVYIVRAQRGPHVDYGRVIVVRLN